MTKHLLEVVNPELESYIFSNNLHLNLITSVSSQLCWRNSGHKHLFLLYDDPCENPILYHTYESQSRPVDTPTQYQPNIWARHTDNQTSRTSHPDL